MTTNIIRKVSREVLYDLWGLPYEPDDELGVKVIEIIDGDSGRWEQHHKVIFVAPDDSKVYSADYTTGLTEYQDQRPWEDEREITLTNVESRQRQVVVTDWIPVKHGTGAIPDLPQRVPGAGPKIPTKEELKAQWASNREMDLWEAEEATW